VSNIGDKDTMAANLKKYLNRSGKERAVVCDEIGIPYSTFSDWLNARRYPNITRVELMANYFGIEKSDLIEKNKNNATVIKCTQIPILGSVAAGLPIDRIVDIKGYIEIPDSMINRGEYFALIIKGDSMQPRMETGDIIIVRHQETIENDEIAVVGVNGEEATVKQVKFEKNGIMLIPLNRDYLPTFFTAEEVENNPVTIIGKVVESRRSYEK